ncbi:hypothetical protein SFC76_03060 [Sphingomonas sp. CD22]|uniref:hypothetical protein n=1 Tax=Sphingomonas sp. CD22 TaxID=3100214 RepID=UPI002ADF30F0|nr:hypothetical protein [Sphingomonas sp. CD22]MEA1083228.1 hypothetical protein [Sphingomonas sp. CD22]
MTGPWAPCRISSAAALPTTIKPAGDGDRDRFATALGSILALVAPTGMDRLGRRVWMEAAFDALRHLPIDVIEKAATIARRTADHPSKVVPAIIAAAEPEIAWRRRQHEGRPAQAAALPAPGGERCTGGELDDICKRYGVGRYADDRAASPHRPTRMAVTADPDRPCRTPSRADYIRLFGIDPGAPAAVAE